MHASPAPRARVIVPRSLGITLALALVFGAHAIDASPAGAQEAEGATPGADAYTQRIQQGIQLLTSGDTTGGINAFREAIALDAARPQAVYYLATANRLAGNVEDALNGFRDAAQKAQAANEPRWRARALQGVASTLERMDGRFEEASQAWQEYVRFADSNQTVSHPQMGRARVSAYTVMSEQERAYVAVRERIAERERERAAEAAPASGRR